LKKYEYIVRLLIAIALVAMPNAQLGLPAGADDISYDTCVSDWQGSWTNLSAIGAGEKALSKPVEEVFCNHFMSVEDFPVDTSSVDAAVATPLFLAPISRLVEPVKSSRKISLPNEAIPHSIAPEVAPHPPKTG